MRIGKLEAAGYSAGFVMKDEIVAILTLKTEKKTKKPRIKKVQIFKLYFSISLASSKAIYAWSVSKETQLSTNISTLQGRVSVWTQPTLLYVQTKGVLLREIYENRESPKFSKHNILDMIYMIGYKNWKYVSPFQKKKRTTWHIFLKKTIMEISEVDFQWCESTNMNHQKIECLRS